jgi:hypothetical protein
MFKFMIVFYDPHPNLKEFERGYARFLGMVEQIPLITRRQVVHVIGSPLGASPITASSSCTSPTKRPCKPR